MKANSFLKKAISFILCAALMLGALGVLCFAADNAQLFSNYVAAIDRAKSLTQKISYRDSAEDILNAYLGAGGSETDDAIAESYQKFLTQCEQIEAWEELCLEFIDVVDAACSGVDLSYEVLSGYMATAEELVDRVDESYVGAYLTDYKSFRAIFLSKIEACEVYVNYAKAAREADTFAEAKQNYDAAKLAEANIEILDYPKLAEAEADLAQASASMFAKIQAAQEFIRAVENISRAESIPKGIKAVYEVLENNDVDTTAEGADEAMRTLTTQERSYDRKVDQSNDALDDVNALIFGLIF